VALGESLFDLGEAAGRDTVRADLVDHALSFQAPNSSTMATTARLMRAPSLRACRPGVNSESDCLLRRAAVASPHPLRITRTSAPTDHGRTPQDAPALPHHPEQ